MAVVGALLLLAVLCVVLVEALRVGDEEEDDERRLG
jgi:hypothetical protein